MTERNLLNSFLGFFNSIGRKKIKLHTGERTVLKVIHVKYLNPCLGFPIDQFMSIFLQYLHSVFCGATITQSYQWWSLKYFTYLSHWSHHRTSSVVLSFFPPDCYSVFQTCFHARCEDTLSLVRAGQQILWPPVEWMSPLPYLHHILNTSQFSTCNTFAPLFICVYASLLFFF